MATYKVTATTTNRDHRVIEVDDVSDRSAAIAAAKEHVLNTVFEPWTAGDMERAWFRAVLVEPRPVHLVVPPAPPETVSAAEYLWECGELVGALEMLRFFERPSRFPELLALWDDEVCRQGERQDERQDERRSTL